MSIFDKPANMTGIEWDDYLSTLRAKHIVAVRKELDALGMMELHARIKQAGCYIRADFESRLVGERLEQELQSLNSIKKGLEMDSENQQVVYIEVSVGVLPEWYDEGEHDYDLERAIQKLWHSNPAYQDAEIRVTYNYRGPHLVRANNEDGDAVFERECDLDEILDSLTAE